MGRGGGERYQGGLTGSGLSNQVTGREVSLSEQGTLEEV